MTIPADDPPLPIRAAVAQAAERLSLAGVPDPSVDAELLLAHLRGDSRGGVQAATVRGDLLAGADAAAFAALVERRAAREPLQHITGAAYFRHLALSVGPGVFVPRPETETVAQLAIDALRADPAPSPIGVDLGTGSGAIAFSLATEVPHARVFAAERSPEAFAWAARNAAAVGADNVRIVLADLADAFADLDGTVSVVVSNPPYVPDDAVPRDPEVRLHDPAAALYGGPDGLDVVRVLSGVAARLLRPGGVLVIEHGEWQGAPVRELLAADGWRATATHPDLTLRDRATTAVRP
ncbi:peptide chain release factor N(5)-glutamine methyltransferase [Microbacterium betulae]|uniref:Release factor glutamine methyltransferase n=1 Tax=Microbacterium betulae TaxID=2981139 RepID=A0AA97I634_9MICO|nr:peptide chain release factor N(5)-glutamine methyltransferase [Microbacterium sp. AB]WOF22110.1 peptide chain release factor N(5)-glutamine methyltransferase [Microbacterium sp. AB]